MAHEQEPTQFLNNDLFRPDEGHKEPLLKMDEGESFWGKFCKEVEQERLRQAIAAQELQTQARALTAQIERAEEQWREQTQHADAVSMALRALLPRIEDLLMFAERQSISQPADVVLGRRRSSKRGLRPGGVPAPLTPLEQLCIAAGEGDMARARKLLGPDGAENERVTNVNVANRIGLVPLHIATRHGHLELVELLLDRGADLRHRTPFNKTPLHLAAMYGHTRVAEALLLHGADVNSMANSDLTPLHMAAMRGHRETAKMLLAAGADVAARNAEGMVPADVASSNSLRLLLKGEA